MVRCGKVKWAWRKYLYIVGSGLGCALVLLLVSVLVLLPAGKFSNTWGELVRTISVDNSAIGAFFSADAAILNQFTPLNLLIYVLLIDTLAFAMIGMMAFVFSMLWGRKVGYMITIVIIYMPTIVLRYMGKFVFFSPFSWLDMNFWRTGYDLEKPSLVYIVAMQLLCHVLLGVIGMIQLQRADWKEEEEA